MLYVFCCSVEINNLKSASILSLMDATRQCSFRKVWKSQVPKSLASTASPPLHATMNSPRGFVTDPKKAKMQRPDCSELAMTSRDSDQQNGLPLFIGLIRMKLFKKYLRWFLFSCQHNILLPKNHHT